MSIVRLSGHLVCVNAAQAEIVRGNLERHLTATRAEPGCLSFDVTGTGDSLVWQVEERFADAAAFTAHQQRVANSEWGRATAGIERRYTIDGR